MKKKRFISVKNPGFMLLVSLLICLVSAIGAHFAKSAGGTVNVKALQWETPSGLIQSAQLYIPKQASAADPAPAIVTAHGWQDGKDMQEANAIELSRRGYVVLAIDMYGHGDSENVPEDSWWDDAYGGNGVYDGVKLLATLPYVDSKQIGIMGHSNGAYANNVAVMLDNKADTPLISAVFLEANDAYYTNTAYYGDFFHGEDTDYVNVYGSRDVGMAAAVYDEIMHRVHYEDGTTTAPGDFMQQATAQSFLHFGQNPDALDNREANTFYTEDIDGEDAVRIIYRPTIFHAWGVISSEMAAQAIEFFQQTLPVPDPLAGSHQIWQWKAAFSAVGIVGFFMFFVYFMLVMLNTRFFGVLKASEPVAVIEPTRKGKARFWRGLIISAILSAVVFAVCFLAGALFRPAFFNQQQTYILGLWSVISGLVALIYMRRRYRQSKKEAPMDLRERGIILSRGILLKTVFLGVLTAIATYAIVFVTSALFQVDFRFWIMIKLRAFDAVKLVEILKFLPFFMIYYVLNSVANNGFNDIRLGKGRWVNTAVVALFNAMGPILLIVFIYSYFLSTGLIPTDGVAWGLSSPVFWVYGLLIILPLAAVLSRIIYRVTRNPYLPAIAYAIVITVMQCTNTLTTTF